MLRSELLVIVALGDGEVGQLRGEPSFHKEELLLKPASGEGERLRVAGMAGMARVARVARMARMARTREIGTPKSEEGRG